jgi:hypothetical protein
MERTAAKAEPTLIDMPDAVDLIRFEKNLLQIGFFGAHERRGQGTSSRRIEQWVNREGKKIKVSAEFRSSDALGLPSTSDRDKDMAFMKLAMETKLRTGVLSNPIRFSGYSLLNVLGQCDSGENYEALNNWGMRMADTTITSEQIIYSSSRKRYMNKTFHVFRSFTRLGASNLDNTNKTDLFEVELEDWLLENLNESYVVPEDFNMYRKLVRPTAKGIFVYLYLWFFASQGKEVEKDYAELCALLNVRRYDHVSKIRETMGLSLTDLVSIGYLKSWDIRAMSSKAGYKLVLNSGRVMNDMLLMTQRKQLAAATNARPTFNAAQQQARKALVEQGIGQSKATELVMKLDPVVIQDRMEYVVQQLGLDHKKNIKNPAGFLISFLEGEQMVPETFVSSRQQLVKQELKATKEALRAQENARQTERMKLEALYDEWCLAEASVLIEQQFSEVELEVRLKQISSQLRKQKTMAAMLDRMTQEQRRRELLGYMKKEVLKEMQIRSIEDWQLSKPQGVLF